MRDALIHHGHYFVLDDYALREEFYPRVVTTLLDGIEKLEGRACRESVAEAGLAKMHEHFPTEKLLLLEEYFLHQLRNELYYWSCRVGMQDIQIPTEFFVDHLIVVRIHYPFLVAREAQRIEQPRFPLKEKVNAALADMRSWQMIVNRLDDFRRRKLAGWLGVIDDEYRYQAETYFHQGLPVPARSHAPHIDTWYGHSYDGINLWWSIAGVNQDNTVILYPELFGKPVSFDPKSMYVKAGNPLPRPSKIELKPGQLLLFNPEILHGTQVNISDETRVAVSTRINPEIPRFNPHAAFHFQHWRSSRDLEQRIFNRIRVFPKRKYRGLPSKPKSTASVIQRSARLVKSDDLTHSPLEICRSNELRRGEKLAVDLANAKILLVRAGDEVHALDRRCPHMGVDLIDGYNDEKEIFCPGHGVAFALCDGASRCQAFRLRRHHAFDRDGSVFVQIDRSTADSD